MFAKKKKKKEKKQTTTTTKTQTTTKNSLDPFEELYFIWALQHSI